MWMKLGGCMEAELAVCDKQLWNQNSFLTRRSRWRRTLLSFRGAVTNSNIYSHFASQGRKVLQVGQTATARGFFFLQSMVCRVRVFYSSGTSLRIPCDRSPLAAQSLHKLWDCAGHLKQSIIRKLRASPGLQLFSSLSLMEHFDVKKTFI